MTGPAPLHALGPRAFDAIVIGGSAGAIDAIATILPALQAQAQVAVLVTLHLPREAPSLLPEIFRPRCALRTAEAQDKEPIEAGTVYFAPPDYHLLVDAGPRLALSVDEPVHFSRPSIDVLFESAADLYGERLMGMLLSGANQDGARGLAAIGAAGGLTIVQAPGSASMSAMPQSALDLMAPHHTLAPSEIASLLAELQMRRIL
ncbi:two-component system chemotaxis response regulator CheB [Acidovorax soli]|uniref:protein-glutamate methylesterase n=1 Tax=Acidovorax soli TaxID=592050 RepID=A0A7X0UB85_9BURK|nr:chemotaxis protein CheB [Acidovorax soli]MBB6561315.1 two-component system chemotaxis response regulator CheB [Acidovorax soli]